ncbi:MAG: hypothetical protein N2378_13100 [Chloroflexaceae bacterium]|nr:hypothetical protein [Chloroflexaceae bacterium]
MILAQYEAPRRLQTDVARLGIAGDALAPAIIQEADRVIAAVEARADRGEAQLDQALAELRALRDTQRQALISFAGAQTGDVTIGDVAGRDIHTPSIAPGGIYAPGGRSMSPRQAVHQLRTAVAGFVGREAEIAAPATNAAPRSRGQDDRGTMGPL